MKNMIFLLPLLIGNIMSLNAQELYRAPDKDTHTIWVSPENPTGQKGEGGKMNNGAKGNPFFIVAPGAKQILLDIEGAGIIKRMWMSGSIAANAEQRRAVRIDMYWDGATKPAVSAPIGDFFGTGLGLMVPFDSELFSNPEGRSFNFTIPMPFRKSAKIEIINESSSHVLFWYDINLIKLSELENDIMYFHVYWNRDPKTKLGNDYEILPKLEGLGRYIGANLSVIGDTLFRGTWFGEGEVKIFLDGDDAYPSLVGTGTEDYIGTGWGQEQFFGNYFGSLVSDKENDFYTFYRYHTKDPVYFHNDIRVTIQQMGATSTARIREMVKNNVEIIPVWVVDSKGESSVTNMKEKTPEIIKLLTMENVPDLFSDEFPKGATGFYRSFDVSATAYFYLDKPESNLPELPPVSLRLLNMKEKVWKKSEGFNLY
jgi:hypothetical protein